MYHFNHAFQIIKNFKFDEKNVEQVFYITNAAALSGCQNSLLPNVLSAPTLTLNREDTSLQEIYWAVYALKAVGRGSVYDREDALKNLIQLLKKDDTPAKYVFILLVPIIKFK